MWLFRTNPIDGDGVQMHVLGEPVPFKACKLDIGGNSELCTYSCLNFKIENPPQITYEIDPFVYNDMLYVIGVDCPNDIYSVWRVDGPDRITRVIKTAALADFGKTVDTMPETVSRIDVLIGKIGKKKIVHDDIGNIYAEGWQHNIVHINVELLTIRLIPMRESPPSGVYGKYTHAVYNGQLYIVHFSPIPFETGTRRVDDNSTTHISLSAFSHLPKDVYPYDVVITNDIIYCYGCERARFNLSDLSYAGRDAIDPYAAKTWIIGAGNMHVYHVTNRQIRGDRYRRENRIMFENMENGDKYEYMLPINDQHWLVLA